MPGEAVARLSRLATLSRTRSWKHSISSSRPGPLVRAKWLVRSCVTKAGGSDSKPHAAAASRARIGWPATATASSRRRGPGSSRATRAAMTESRPAPAAAEVHARADVPRQLVMKKALPPDSRRIRSASSRAPSRAGPSSVSASCSVSPSDIAATSIASHSTPGPNVRSAASSAARQALVCSYSLR